MREPSPSFDHWYREVHRGLSASLVVAFGDPELAAEAADEAVARAYERWSRVQAMDSPGGWTYRVAFNVARRRRRRRAAEQLLLQRAKPTSAVPGPAGELWLLVAELPERQRVAIALRHVAGLTEREVGEAMGITRGTVSATLRNAYRSLRTELVDDDLIEETTP